MGRKKHIPIRMRRMWRRPHQKNYEVVPWQNIQQTAVVANVNTFMNYQLSMQIVPPDSNNGIRTVKHITINISDDTITGGGTAPSNITWAVVYNPEGSVLSPLGLKKLNIYL